MPSQGQGRDMQLRIVACRPMYHGRNKKGDEYDIYEVEAAKPDGTLVNEKLRSFSALPVGETIELTVTPFNSERHGQSFTLHPKRKAGGGSTQAMNEIREEWEHYKEGLRKLAARVRALEEHVHGQVRSSATPAPQTSQAAELDRRFGADPPEGDTW